MKIEITPETVAALSDAELNEIAAQVVMGWHHANRARAITEAAVHAASGKIGVVK
jgi:hypothetical protein